MILDNGLIRDEHFKTIKYSHDLHIDQKDHDALRKRLAENGWTEVDNRFVFDAHEEWVKGEYGHQYIATFPGCWTRTKEGHNTISFQLSIQVKTGFTDYTREDWDAKWKKRKEQGYVVADTYEIVQNPTVRLCDVKFKPYRQLDRMKERMGIAIEEAEKNEVLDAYKRLKDWENL